MADEDITLSESPRAAAAVWGLFSLKVKLVAVVLVLGLLLGLVAVVAGWTRARADARAAAALDQRDRKIEALTRFAVERETRAAAFEEAVLPKLREKDEHAAREAARYATQAETIEARTDLAVDRVRALGADELDAELRAILGRLQ